MNKITLNTLRQYKRNQTKFSCLTCYDATFAAAMQRAQIDTILVGDSLGMLVRGEASTLPVTVEDMVYHTQNVAKGNQHALIMTDLPFMSYATLADAIAHSRAVMQAGAHVVKLEGGAKLAETVTVLANNGVPTCVHLGLIPQSVNIFGGYKVQAKQDDAAAKLLADCQQVVAAGAALLLLECVPKSLAAKVQSEFDVPVIGIGAGEGCDGQVLVMHDMLGLHSGKAPRFVHDFLQSQPSIEAAFASFHQAVKSGEYPKDEHSFK